MLNASRMIKEWAKANSKYKLPPRWLLTKARLQLKSGKFCHYSGKGWHTGVLMSFLEDFLEQKEFDSDVKMLLWSGNHVMKKLHTARDHGLLLTGEEQEEIQTIGEYHVRLFLSLHVKYANACPYRLWHPRPKVHMMCHIFDVRKGRNPAALSCWMDEDWVKGVARVAKKCHGKTSHRTTLQRYSAGPHASKLQNTFQPFTFFSCSCPFL